MRSWLALATIAGTLTVGVGVGVATAPATATATAPATTATGSAPSAAALAGGFLERQLRAGGHVLPYPGSDQPDLGLTIDAALAMTATGVGASESAAAVAVVETHLDDFVGPTWGATELYAGPLAKSALLATTMGRDPHRFGGHDLIAELASLQQPNGQYADRTAYGDTANSFTQALALLALTRASAPVPEPGIAFLTLQQCADGGFRMFVDAGACVADPDATALAVTALAALNNAGRFDPVTERALDFLEGRIESDGGVPGGAGASSANSNTTGLAAMAFAVSGRTRAHDLTAGFLRSLQFGCRVPAPLRGGLAYDTAGYAAQLAAGTRAEASDQERRASAQGTLGLAGVGLGERLVSEAIPGGPALDCPGGSTTSTTSPSTSTTPTTSTTSSPATKSPPATTSATASVTSTPPSTPSAGSTTPVGTPTASATSSASRTSSTSALSSSADASTTLASTPSTAPRDPSTSPTATSTSTAGAPAAAQSPQSGSTGAAGSLPRQADPEAVARRAPLTPTEQAGVALGVAATLLAGGALAAAGRRRLGRHR